MKTTQKTKVRKAIQKNLNNVVNSKKNNFFVTVLKTDKYGEKPQTNYDNLFHN